MSMSTVKVSNVSLGASEQDIREFFSFSGIIEHIEMKSENEQTQTAFVTFKDPQGAETAVLFSGATIANQPVAIALEPDYVPPSALSEPSDGSENTKSGGDASTFQKAEEVVTNMLSKGFVLGKDALNRAKAFDEQHGLTSTATEKIASLDRKIGLSNKVSTGAALVNDKAKEMDQQFGVSERAKSAYAAAAGSAIMKNRYILTGTSWVTGAFNRARKAAEDVGQKTMGKAAEDEHGNK